MASPSGPLAAALAEIGLRDRTTVVDSDGPIAVTVGVFRPRVVVSTGLVAVLKAAELRAVLAHEHRHLRSRDPLRILTGRVLAAHLWFLPVALDLRARARRGYELAADRHALRHYGRAATAGALLRLSAAPMTVPAGAAPLADPEVLAARVAQLESGQPPNPPTISTLHSATTFAGALAFVLAVFGAWLFMLVTCPGMSAVGMG